MPPIGRMRSNRPNELRAGRVFDFFNDTILDHIKIWFGRRPGWVAGRVQRIARDGVKTAALDECRRPPTTPPRPG